MGSASIPNIIDGTLCRSSSSRPGTVGVSSALAAPVLIGAEAYRVVYCEVWTESQRRAFWKGFLGRANTLVDDVEQLLIWIQDAFGVGDDEGDFEAAWTAFGDGLNQLGQLAWKVTVVVGVPLPLAFHPKRNEFRKELADLGWTITNQWADLYKRAYESGGIPECTGVLLADVLALAIQVVGTKGLASTAKLAKFLPAKLKKALPELKKQPRLPDSTALLTAAKRIKLDPKGRPVALFFGIGDARKIPPRFATVNTMLGDTTEGQRLLKQLERLPWKQQEEVWWELSDRVAPQAGKSGTTHVYVSKAYHERFFPDPAKLKSWWGDHKSELIAIREKKLRSQNLAPDQVSDNVAAYRKKLDSWRQDDIEAQYYAVQGKNRFSGKYEDEIFHKIEKLHLQDIEFHAIDEAGGEIRKWKHRTLPDSEF